MGAVKVRATCKWDITNPEQRQSNINYFSGSLQYLGCSQNIEKINNKLNKSDKYKRGRRAP